MGESDARALKALADRFGELALMEAEARATHDIAKSKSLRAEMDAVEEEFKLHGLDGQAALTVLASTHHEERVRLEAVAAVYRAMVGSKAITANLVRRMARAADAAFLDPREPSVARAPAMERAELQGLTAEQLVDRFMALAIDYDDEDSPPENDRLYWQLDNVKDELKARDPETWRLLLALYTHPDIRIRHQAAEATQEQLPELARDRLLALDDVEWFPPENYAELFSKIRGRACKPSGLRAMTVEQLLKRFIDLVLDQEEASAKFQIAKANRLFWLKTAVEEELKARDGDERRALLRLFEHPSTQVRLKAAKATLAVAPKDARRVLEAIAVSGEYPQAGDAGMCLSNLDEDMFKPT